MATYLGIFCCMGGCCAPYTGLILQHKKGIHNDKYVQHEQYITAYSRCQISPACVHACTGIALHTAFLLSKL